jgi:hypothetical protein
VVRRVVADDVPPLRAWREHLGLTQAEVATRLGISQPAYAQQENSARLSKTSGERIAILALPGRGVCGLAEFQAGSDGAGAGAPVPGGAARRACTVRGIKRWPGLSPEDAIGKAGSGCFPDLPETGYYQTLRVTERSPQKSVSKAAAAASGKSVAPAWPVCPGPAVRRESGSDRIVNGNRSHYKENYQGATFSTMASHVAVHGHRAPSLAA